MVEKDWLFWTALVFVLISGLNWAFYAFGYDLVQLIFGSYALAKTVYALFTLSTIYILYTLFDD